MMEGAAGQARTLRGRQEVEGRRARSTFDEPSFVRSTKEEYIDSSVSDFHSTFCPSSARRVLVVLRPA